MARRKGMRAGWFPDPAVERRFRWWDGEAWTAWVASNRRAGRPEPGGDRVVPVLSRRDKVVRGFQLVAVLVVVVSVVMAAVGVRTNRRRAPQPAASITVSAAPTVPDATRPTLSPDGMVTFADLATMRMPSGFQHVSRGDGSPGLFSSLVFSVAPGGPTEAPATSVLIGWAAPLVTENQKLTTAQTLARVAAGKLYAKAGKVTVLVEDPVDEPRWGERHPAARVTGSANFVDPQSGKATTDQFGLTLVRGVLGQWIAVFWLASGQMPAAQGTAARTSVESLDFTQ